MRAFFLMGGLRSPDAAQRVAVRSRAGVYHLRVGPGSAERREERRTASGTRCIARVRMTTVCTAPMYRFHPFRKPP